MPQFFLIILLTFAGCVSQDIASENGYALAAEAEIRNLKRPQPDPDGRIQTMNKMGAESPKIDEISQAFINVAVRGARVIDMGTGYGRDCLAALEGGATCYDVCDLSRNQLMILARMLKEKDPILLEYVEFFPGDAATIALRNSFYDAVLLARVLHFMAPEKAVATLKKAYKSLKPGGEIYIVALSPYVAAFESFIPVFEDRIQKGDPFPGWVDKLSDWADPKLVSPPARAKMDKPFLFFNHQTAKALLEQAGFVVKTIKDIPIEYESVWQGRGKYKGHENVGIIAYKPPVSKL